MTTVGIVGGGIGGVQAMSTVNNRPFHLPHGPEQRKRDAHVVAGPTGRSCYAVARTYQRGTARLPGSTDAPVGG
jgi:hypothetical protein